MSVAETTLAEFYDSDARETVYLVRRASPKHTWWVIRQGDSPNVVGYNREGQARERFRQLRGMTCA